MEWERAKNFLLVFFLLLNVVLGALLVWENSRYSITNEQERLIRTVLNRNNISIYRIPTERFPPMRPINVTGFYYDTYALVEIFFENPAGVTHTQHLGSHIFECFYSDSIMEIFHGFVSFDKPAGFAKYGDEVLLAAVHSNLSLDTARALTDVFVHAHFPDFVLDSVIHVGASGIIEGLRLTYRQNYHGMLVHSNFVEFFVEDIGIVAIEMEFGEILGHTGSPSMISSPDEALLAFVQRMRHITPERPMIITHMDLVFFQEYVSDQPGPYQAVPFYRIFIEGDEDRPFLINAFTNTIID